MAQKTILMHIRDALSKTTVEPFVFLAMFAFNVRQVAFQSLFHDRACRVSLGYSVDICDNLDVVENEEAQTASIKYGNNLYNAFIMISTIPALVMAIFLGPWSDRYSRKYPILIAVTGTCLDSSIQAVITSFPDASPFLHLAGAAISGFSGGYIIIMSSTYSYMSDATDEKSRPTRFAILEFFTIMATPIGAFVGGQVFRAGGYLPVMIVAPVSFALAWLWMRFYVVETKARRIDITWRDMAKDLFKVDNVKASFKTCAQARPGNLKLQIWLLVFVSFCMRLISLGSISIGFPYTRLIFKWSVPRYSYTTTVFSLLNAVATLVLVPVLNKKLLVHEAAVGLVGILSLMAKMALMAAAVHEWVIFYAWFAGCLFACGGIAVRSRISKLVNKKELGRVFSLIATCESLAPVLGTITMTQIYNSSVECCPGIAYIVAAIFLVPAALIFGWMMRMPTMSIEQYTESETAKGMKELQNVPKQSETEATGEDEQQPEYKKRKKDDDVVLLVGKTS